MSSFRLKYMARPSIVVADLTLEGDPPTVGVEGSPYDSGPIIASGGRKPYTFAVDRLPPGVTISPIDESSVHLSGTLTEPGLTEEIVVSVTDAFGDVDALAPFDLTVAAIPETVDYLATNLAELQSAFATAMATGLPKVIGVADGAETEYGSAIIDLRAKSCTARVTIRGISRWGAKLPGFDLEGSSNIRIEELELYRSRTTGGVNLAGVVRAHNTTNCSIRNNHIHSDPLATADLSGYAAVSGGNGLSFIDGEAVSTSSGGAGVFRIRPRSSASIVAISGSDPGTTCAGYLGGGNGGGGSFASLWAGKTMTGLTSGATRVVGAIVSDIEFLSGVATGSSGTQATNLEVVGNAIHDVKRGIQVGGPGLVIRNNLMTDCYIGGWDITGQFDDLDIGGNEVFGIWAIDTDGQPSGTNGPHSGLSGLSASDRNISNMSIVGERGSVGRNRFNALGSQAFATAPKMNDSGVNITGRIDGTTLTVTDVTSVWKLRAGHRLVDSFLLPGTRIEEQLTGVMGEEGTYRLNNSQAISSRSLQVQARYQNALIRSCLWECNGSIALEVDFAEDIDVLDVQVVSCRDSAIDVPSIYIANIGPGARFTGSVANNFNLPATISSGLGNYGVDPETFELSGNNINVLRDATSGPASYEENFMGIGGPTPFSGATRENLVQMWTPRPGGRVALAGVGPMAHYDFATGIASDVGYVKSAATEEVGLSLPRVLFGSGVYGRYTVTPNTLPLMGIERGDVLTFITLVRVLGDADGYLFGSGSSALSVRRLPASSRNRLRVTVAGGVAVSAESSFGVTAADGPVLLAVSVDTANYQITMAKGAMVDPFSKSTAWTGAPMSTGSDYAHFLGSGATTPASLLPAEVGLLYFTDEYLDLADQAVISRYVAQDGNPLDWGADGSLLTGTRPRVFQKGNAASWETNLGSAPSNFTVLGGAITDAS